MPVRVVRQLVAPPHDTVCPDAGEANATSQMRVVATVSAVRRIVFILAPLFLVVATAMPAWAHPGIEDPYVPAGRITTLVLGVPSEEPAAMTAVDIALPPDFTLSRLDQTPGWQSASTPPTLHFTGGNAPQGTYVQFTFAGTFAKKAVLLLPVTTHAVDGTVVHWDGKA